MPKGKQAVFDAYITEMKEIARKHKLKATVLTTAAKAAV